MSDKKFDTLFEAAMGRYQTGGFLYGDRVEFVDGFRSKEEFNSLGDNVKEMIDQMINSGLHVRVTAIRNDEPTHNMSSPPQQSMDTWLDIALDSGGGRYTHLVTIPACLVQPVEDYPNLPPIPDEVRRKTKYGIKPEEAEEDSEHITRKTDRGTGTLSNTEVNTPQKNVSIPSKPASPDPAVNAYFKALAK